MIYTAKRPWTARHIISDVDAWEVYDADEKFVKRFYGPHAEAHARMFAAGPEMVEALEKLQKLGEQGMEPDYTSWLTFHDKVVEIARAALKKLTAQEDRI